jgi:hypothetical protein
MRGDVASRGLNGAVVALCLMLQAGAVTAATLPPLVDGEHLAAGWRTAVLPQQGSKPVTQFSAERIDGRAALRVDADRSYGNRVFDLAPGAPPQRLRWSWRLQVPNGAADLHQRGGDDAAVKVCASFDLPLDQLPFTDRQFLRLARASSAQALPAATVCYVWAGTEPRGALIANAFTRRVRYIVLRNAIDGVGAWVDESRDLAADFLRAFGDESPQVPALVAVIVGGDADNTGLHTVAHVTALRFEP